jgi:hypothetical protein
LIEGDVDDFDVIKAFGGLLQSFVFMSDRDGGSMCDVELAGYEQIIAYESSNTNEAWSVWERARQAAPGPARVSISRVASDRTKTTDSFRPILVVGRARCLGRHHNAAAIVLRNVNGASGSVFGAPKGYQEFSRVHAPGGPESGTEWLTALRSDVAGDVGLSELSSASGPSVPQPFEWFRSLAEQVGVLHALGYVHGRIDPDHVRVVLGQPVLVGGDAPSAVVNPLGRVNQFMSPEEVRGLPASAAADICSLGAMLAWLLGGENVFPEYGGAFDLLEGIRKWRTHARRVAEGISDVGVGKVVERAMSLRPDDRYASVADMLGALRDCVGDV